MSGTRELFQRHVLGNYGRLDTELARGEGARVWDVQGRSYLDMGAGIAVCCLGHSHPALSEAVARQAGILTHVSNLYYHRLQGELARRLAEGIGPGACFFCNSGAEANEAAFKLARRAGHAEGRFEILSCRRSFHGRTLACVSATGQDKAKEGFGPLVPGFRHVPFNDLEAMEAAVSPSTIAVVIEGIQGEGGIHPARPGYLSGLRSLCDRHGLLLLFDGVQCGHFRTGRFQSYQRILEGLPQEGGFLPDAVSMAKSMGGGFPMGALWIREDRTRLLGPGSHGTTYGGSPLACAAALAVLDEIEASQLDRKARETGRILKSLLEGLQERHPGCVKEIRGLGLMIGIEFHDGLPGLPEEGVTSLELEKALRQEGLLLVPAGPSTLRMLPPLNLGEEEAAQAVEILEQVLRRIAP